MKVKNYIIVLILSSLALMSGCKKSIRALNDQVETPVDSSVTVFLTGTANYASLRTWDDYEVTPPENGTLTGSGYKRTYTPDAGFTGVDTIRFRLGTEGEYTKEATIRVYVGSPSGRIDRHGFDDYTLRGCARDAAKQEKATYVSELRTIDCTGSRLLIGGTKYFWLDEVIDNCFGCDYGIRLSSLDGLEAFTGLESLSIDRGTIADLSPIAALSGLTELHLPEVDGSQISVLTQLGSLQALSFDSPSLVTLADITALSLLESLHVGDIRSPDFDISSIGAASWPNLTSFSLAGEITSLVGLESADLSSLTDFSFSGYSYTDLAALTDTAIPNLETLTIVLTESESLQNFTGNRFSNLREMDIRGFELLSFTELVDNEWPALESLTLKSSLYAYDLAGTENLQLPALTTLDMHEVRNLTDLSALLTWDMPNIETIILTRAQNTLPCSEVARVEAQFPDADVQTNINCLE